MKHIRSFKTYLEGLTLCAGHFEAEITVTIEIKSKLGITGRAQGFQKASAKKRNRPHTRRIRMFSFWESESIHAGLFLLLNCSDSLNFLVCFRNVPPCRLKQNHPRQKATRTSKGRCRTDETEAGEGTTES